MLPTRRSLRAARIRRIRSLTAGSIAVGAAVGLVTVTLTTGPAWADAGEHTSLAAATAATVPAAAATARAETLHEVTAEARSTLDAARTAIAEADKAAADVSAAGLDVGPVTSIDTTELTQKIDELAGLKVLPLMLLPGIVDETVSETNRIAGLTETLRGNLEAAQAKKAAEEAAAKAKAEAEAAAAAAAALAAANTPEGAKATARQLIGGYGWGGDQFGCLERLWTRESDWNYQAYNASSGATGIPQSLPGNKMASAGADWQTNAATQIRWGLDYISRAYGTPCAAWGHSNATGWY